MKELKPIERLKKLHTLIRNEKTGTPDCLAKQLGISRRMVYENLTQLKLLGAEIAYSRTTETYYYTTNFDMEITISIRVLQNSEVKEVFGGKDSCYYTKRVLVL